MLLLVVVLALFSSAACAEKACNIFGDPHIFTFDGFKYKVDGECNYVLSMDCIDMSWIVYGRFAPCGRGKCLEDISLFSTKNGVRDAILIGRGWVINHQGTKVAYKQGTDFQIGNVAFSFDGFYLTIIFLDAGVTLTYDGFTGLQIAIDDSVPRGKTCGLCGNNDGNSDNEGIQHRDIGNDVEGAGLVGVEELVFRWKVDRGDYCEHPISVQYSRQLPCGNDYRRNEAARAACQELVDNQELFKCHSTLNLNTFYEACLTDFCNINILTDGYPVACTTASAYAKHCQILGVRVQDEIWRSEMSCPEASVIQQAIIGIGVEQPGDGPIAV